MARCISHLAFILACLLGTVSANYEYPEPEKSLQLLLPGSYGNTESAATAEAKRTESVSTGITVQPAIFQGGRITLGGGGGGTIVRGSTSVADRGVGVRGTGGVRGTTRESISTGLGSSYRPSGGRIGGTGTTSTNSVLRGGEPKVEAQTIIGSSVSTLGSNIVRGGDRSTITGGRVSGGLAGGGRGVSGGRIRPNNDVSYLNPDPIARLSTAIPRGGVPGRDYPILSSVPQTGFSCNGLISGYYADTDQEARCQVYHTCNGGKQNDFLCPNGTIFNQQFSVCDWWYNVDCGSADLFFGRNAEIGNPFSKTIANDNIGLASAPQRSVSKPSSTFGKALSKANTQASHNYDLRGNSKSKTISGTLTEKSNINGNSYSKTDYLTTNSNKRNKISNSKTSGYLTENKSRASGYLTENNSKSSGYLTGNNRSTGNRSQNYRGSLKYQGGAGIKRIYTYNANGRAFRPTEYSDTLVVPLEKLLIL